MTQQLYITTHFKIYIFIYTPNQGQCHKTAHTRPKIFKYSLTVNSYCYQLYYNSTENCHLGTRTQYKLSYVVCNWGTSSREQRKHCQCDSFSTTVAKNVKKKRFQLFTVSQGVPQTLHLLKTNSKINLRSVSFRSVDDCHTSLHTYN